MSDYYEDYWKQQDWRPDDAGVRPEEENLIERHFGNSEEVLDYGCGSGVRYGMWLKSLGHGYHGCDISDEALEQARGHGLDVHPIRPEDGSTSLQSGSFSRIMCMEVLEHLESPENALSEIRRLLRPDGIFICSVPNPGIWFNRIEFLLTGFLCPGGSPVTSRRQPWADPHLRFYNVSTMKSLLAESGFTVHSVQGGSFTLGSLPYVYRQNRMKTFFNAISKPCGFLGRLFPGVFSGTLYFVAQPAGAEPRGVA